MRQLPDISLRQLEYLVAVADHDTWASAAADVGVSPSALSQGIAELERRVGVELFEAQGRRRVLRASAQPVLDHARQVVSLTSDLVAWSDRVRTSELGRVRLGMIDVAAVDHFPEVLRAFRRDFPGVELTMSVAPSAELLADLRAGRLDLVVCVPPVEWPVGVVADDLLFEEIAVYAPAGTKIGRPETWGPWVLFPTSSHSRHQILAHLRERGAPTQVVAASHQSNVLREMVTLGLGWTALPRASEPADSDLVRGPVLYERRLALVRREGGVADPAALELTTRLMSAQRSS